MIIEKKDKKYFEDKAEKAISELVYTKSDLLKAYNYYSSIRDKKLFEHIELNYGLGNATELTFTPLIKKHIDTIIGEFLTLPHDPLISCKDETTISNILREKLMYINGMRKLVISSKLNNLVYSLLKKDGKNKIEDAVYSRQLKEAREAADRNFTSDYEITALNVIEHIRQSRNIDFMTKITELMYDFCISGSAYFQIIPTSGNNEIDFKVLNPLNFFPELNVNSKYIQDSYRAVYREYLSKSEILIKYGDKLTKELLETISKQNYSYEENSSMVLLSINSRFGISDVHKGIQDGLYAQSSYIDENTVDIELLPVYSVEWIDVDYDYDKKIIQNRYKTVRIGSDIYIHYGKDENVTRSMIKPRECKLSVNGLCNSTRTGHLKSLMLDTMDLQDRYDIALFIKNNLVANSGTTGDWVDIACIPSFLGPTVEDRLIKWIGYKKSGIGLIDSSLEGQLMNTTFNGFDDTVRLLAILAIDLVIQDIENTAISFTGVFRERIGGILQRDAVRNVEVGMLQSFINTKHLFLKADLLVREVLLDSLNVAKIVYKNGLYGSIVLGDRKVRIFTALPEHFTMTDYDINLPDSQEILKEKDMILLLSMLISTTGAVSPDILIDIATSKSLTEMKQSVLDSIKNQKEETNQIGQLAQLLEQSQQQIKQYESELKKLQTQIQKFNKDQMDLERDKVNKDYDIKNKQVQLQKEFNDKKILDSKRRTDLEALQLIDNNPNNDEIKDN